MKKRMVVCLLIAFSLLSGCTNSDNDMAGQETDDLAHIDEMQNDDVVYIDPIQGDIFAYVDEGRVPREILQWFIDSGVLEQPCSEEAWKALHKLEPANEMVATYNSNIFCSRLPQGYYLYYRIEVASNRLVLSWLALSESTPKSSLFSAAREDFPALEQKIRSALQQTE